MRRYIYETLHPDIYHGYNKKPPFFEGWYYKLINADTNTRFAVIPGIFKTYDTAGDHAFVQILDGMTGRATYHTYPVDAFVADEERFDIRVGNNRFLFDRIELDIADDERTIRGVLRLTGGRGWPVSMWSPGVMGWYAWLPFMECYHGITSFDHRIDGALEIDGGTVSFDDGRGYIEKDWGQAFPSAYVWTQSNHFTTPGTCLTASVAMIPSVGRTFRGFLAGLYIHGMLYPFTTYTGARTTHLAITDDHVEWVIRDRRHTLTLNAERAEGSLLHAPVRTDMHRRVNETLKSNVHVRLAYHDGTTLFDDTGRAAGLEVHGDLDTLLSAT